jgi:SOS-response transcriptional repressor LexA
MSDDDSETTDALDRINDLVPRGSDCYWEMVDGDLMFWDGPEEG